MYLNDNKMEKLTREQLKNVKGGLQTPPAGCFCFTPTGGPGPGLPGGGLDLDCSFGQNPELYCPADQLLGCC
ncbi:MAG: hypothetical protein JWP45_1761 [Mucilaginibacter sp.]|nr:hypothetical protein [Mucilaginibacter sp.]